jgi:hypothetical protein
VTDDNFRPNSEMMEYHLEKLPNIKSLQLYIVLPTPTSSVPRIACTAKTFHIMDTDATIAERLTRRDVHDDNDNEEGNDGNIEFDCEVDPRAVQRIQGR